MSTLCTDLLSYTDIDGSLCQGASFEACGPKMADGGIESKAFSAC